jgi:copper resistance protein D
MTELSALVRFVHLAAAVLLVGSHAFLLSIALSAVRCIDGAAQSIVDPHLRFHCRITRSCLLLLLFSALLSLWLQLLNVSDPTASPSMQLSALTPFLTETLYGKIWLLRTVIIIGGIFLISGRKQTNLNPVPRLAIGFVLSAALLASVALSGHAAAAEGFILIVQILTDGSHLLASGIWLGGLVPLFVFLSRCNRISNASAYTIAQEAARRFSRLGLICVSLLIVTGSYNAWILVGGFPALFGTPYGKLLSIKLGLLLPLLAVAAVNLFCVKPSMMAGPLEKMPTLAKKLKRNVVIEAFFGMLILLIVGHMGVTPPARHVQPEWPFSFRWDWRVLEKAPKTRAEVERGLLWAAVGGVAMIAALARRRRRTASAVVALGALGYAAYTIHNAVLIDAYPATYKRPAVTYNAISVANGSLLYQDSGCVTCHGLGGYGDGPAAQDFDPKPADLTAPHANAHTAGDLFWWLSHGVKPASAMPGFSQSLSEEERWDLINFMRALSSGERARSLAAVIEDKPWLVAPDFSYGTYDGQIRTLKDLRGDKIVLLIVLNVKDTEERLKQVAGGLSQLRSADLEIIVVPNLIDQQYVADKLPGLIVSEGIREITETYKLFARSFADETAPAATPHVEFLIDKQGYIRARWLPAENAAWQKIDVLLKQVELLRNEKPRAPAPDEHVH